MEAVEKVSFELPAEILDKVRQAVTSGEYSSDNDVVRVALHAWSLDREMQGEDIEYLRAAWNAAIADDSPGLEVDEVFDRIERRLHEKAG